MNKHEQFTLLVAKGSYFWDDYGNNCSFCDGNGEDQHYSDNNKFIHAADCATLKARKVLGKTWTHHLKAEKIRLEREYETARLSSTTNLWIVSK